MIECYDAVGEENATSAVVIYLFLFWVEHIPEQQTNTNNVTQKKRHTHTRLKSKHINGIRTSFYDCQNNRTHIQCCKTCGNSK